MPMQEGKKRVTITLDWSLVRTIEELSDGNLSAFINSALYEHLKNFDELLEQKAQKQVAEGQTILAEIEAKRKQKKAEEEAKQKELESQKAEALKEIDALNLTSLSDSWVSDNISSEVQKIASKHGLNWEKNPTEMSVLMNRVSDRKAEERITGE
jgi:hypothetical protein